MRTVADPLILHRTSEQARDVLTVTLGCVAGGAVIALHHVHHAVTGEIPDNILIHALIELAAGAIGGLIAGSAVAVLRKRRQ